MTAVIFYATREGHTRRIAERIANDLNLAGVPVDLFDMRTAGAIDWTRYSAACVAASVHVGRHEREAVEFVKAHRASLERVHAAFISVTLSEAGVENPNRTDAERKHAAEDVQRMIDDFLRETGWRPREVLPVAGALAYTKYNPLLRFVMKRIARRAGGPTDTSRDHVLTDWRLVDGFAKRLAGV